MTISWSLWINPDSKESTGVLEKDVFNTENWPQVTDLLSMTRTGIDSELFVLKANSLKDGKTYAVKVTGRFNLFLRIY